MNKLNETPEVCFLIMQVLSIFETGRSCEYNDLNQPKTLKIILVCCIGASRNITHPKAIYLKQNWRGSNNATD